MIKKTQHINLIINNLGSDLDKFIDVVNAFLAENKTVHNMGIKLLQILELTSRYNF